MINIMIADDQELIRESLQVVLNLNPEFSVTGVAQNGSALIELVKNNAPDVILMDVRMPETDGVVATREINRLFPDVRIIILTTFDDDEYVYNALKYGASGYLLKGVSVPDLTDAIKKVAAGGSILNPDVTDKVIKLFTHMAQNDDATASAETGDKTVGKAANKSAVAELTRTERNVAYCVGNGLSNKEIAEKLCISPGTVRNNLSSALAKLNLRDRTQLAIWALNTGLISAEVN